MQPLVHQTAAAETMLDWNSLQHELEDLIWQGKETRHDASSQNWPTVVEPDWPTVWNQHTATASAWAAGHQGEADAVPEPDQNQIRCAVKKGLGKMELV